MSANANLITMDMCSTRENNLKTSLKTIYGPKCKQNVYFGLFFLGGEEGGPCGVFNNQTMPILLSSYPLTHIDVHIKSGSNLIRSLNPKYEEPLHRTKPR